MTVPTGSGAPVVLFIYRRPEHTRQVFRAIRSARPGRLFVVSDEAPDLEDHDAVRVAAARAVTEHVDWECEVVRLYASSHLGCRERMISGLDVVFDEVEKAIILEDDCVPDLSFFTYANELLDRYEHEPRIMSIGGHLWHLPDGSMPHSYWFSVYPMTWGWATWRRAWMAFEHAAVTWPQLRETSWLEERLGGPGVAAQFWRAQLDSSSTWDYTWTLAHWMNDSLAVRPSVNLVANIGLGDEATHTRDGSHPAIHRPASSVSLPLSHPPLAQADVDRDREIEWVDHSGFVTRRLRAAHRLTRASQALGHSS